MRAGNNSRAAFLPRSGLLTAVFILVVSCLPAHEQKAALTDIYFNGRTGNLEISHRFSIHDAEHTLRKATDHFADLVESSRDQAAFADYVCEHFELSSSDKQPIELTLVGQELEGGYLWIYQEAKIEGPVKVAFYVKNSVLMDVVEDQINTVNVRDRFGVSTFVFDVTSKAMFYRRPFQE